MGLCSICGQKAGLFASTHKECEIKKRQGPMRLQKIADEAVGKPERYEVLEDELKAIAAECYLSDVDVLRAMAGAYGNKVTEFLDDGILSTEEEAVLLEYKNRYDLDHDVLDEVNNGYTRTVQAVVLRELFEGLLPTRVKIDGAMPINLQKSEQLVWYFNSVEYYEEKTFRQFAGASVGGSMRIAKGLYVRTSSFRGTPVERSQMVHVSNGALAVTDKHLYFAGTSKSFKVPYQKIVSFQAFDDGIGIHRDAATAKPQIFKTGDGWFIYNLVSNLARRA